MNGLKKYIRDIPGFPKEGVIFKDITPLLKNGKVFKEAIDLLAAKFKTKKPPPVLNYIQKKKRALRIKEKIQNRQRKRLKLLQVVYIIAI